MVYLEKPDNFNHKFEIVSCFIEFENKILLLHRLPEKSQGNKWGNAAGKVEVGEDLISAMQREIFEETGLNIEENKLNFLDKSFVEYPDTKFIYNIFKTKFFEKPEIKINLLEHQNFGWFTPQEALEKDLVLDQDYYIRRDYLIS